MSSKRRIALIGGWLAALVLCLASPALAQTRPQYQLLHFNERWIPLREGWDDEDYFDPIKHVSFGESGFITFGGDASARAESWRNFAFGAPDVDDDDILFHRVSAFADVHFNRRTRLFGEIISANSTERKLPGGRRPIDVNSLDFKNFFLDHRIDMGAGEGMTVRVGRQQFAFGSQRLISALPWANSFNRWDGISAIFDAGRWKIHGLAAFFTPVRQYDFDEPDTDDKFFGAYATRGPDLDLYYIGRQRDELDETRHTLGFRHAGKFANAAVDYEIETAWQFGDRAGRDIFAGMFTGVLGYSFLNAGGRPRVALGVDWASGDSDPSDNDFETFDQLKPLGHAYLGYIDLVGRQNIIDLSSGVDWRPGGGWTLKAAAHYFLRAEEQDALFNPAGGVVRPGAAGSSDEVGAELDLTAARSFGRHWLLLLGYSVFSAGDFIKETGEDETTRFMYGMLTFKF